MPENEVNSPEKSRPFTPDSYGSVGDVFASLSMDFRDQNPSQPLSSHELEGADLHSKNDPIGVAAGNTSENHLKTPVSDADFESSFTADSARAMSEENSKTSLRSKSSQRMRYEAEVGLIKKKLGDLEGIREQLGLTQRKMCQLLFVDPSAWTRWVKNGEMAPPHIYRSLQWYLALQEKYPALDVNFWLSTVARTENLDEVRRQDRIILDALSERYFALEAKMKALKAESEKDAQNFALATQNLNQHLNDELKTQRRRGLWLLAVAVIASGVVGGVITGLVLRFS